MSDTLGNQITPDGSGGTPSPGPDQAYTYADRQSNLLTGASMAAEEQGSSSIFETASNILTKGIPLTATAVVNSFYNTAAEVGNFLGADIHKATIEDEFGPDSDMTSYYQQHSGAIEGTALAAGSLIPGLGATKILKLAQAGELGNTMRIVTGLASGIRGQALSAAADDIVGNTTGASLFGLNAVNKTKAILAGVADNALQGAVYETATLATMHASPLTDNNSLGDDISDVISSAKGFAVVGGLIDGASALYKIKSAIKNADFGTKDQEAFGALGKGNLTPGDRIVNLYNTLDNIQGPTTRLGQMKLNITQNTTGRLIQDQLIEAAGKDTDLAGAFRGFLEAGRTAGTIGADELQNNLGQLSKIGRLSDTNIASRSSDVFYIPSVIDPRLVSVATHDEVMSRIATGDTANSRALQLSNPNVLPTIGRATDRITVPNLSNSSILSSPAYAGAMDAYKNGVDIFVGAGGKTHVNPASGTFKEVSRPGESRALSVAEREEYTKTGNLPADSKPLDAVGLTLDLTNGKLYGEDPLPVVGDFAKPSIYPNGLRVGDALFPQKPGVEFSPSSPLDANSRYVWASMRGIKDGDSIHPTDLPMMEQLYREKVAGFTHDNLTEFSDGSSIPQDPKDLLQHIADTKQAQYASLLQDGKNADEIGHILNSPTAGLTKNFNTLDATDIIQDPNVSANIRHVRLAYDIGTTKDSQGNLLRGMQATNYRMKLAADANSTQVSNYLSKIAGAKAQDYFHALQFTKGAGDADITGAGAKFLSNANADYGTIGVQAQRMGRAASDLMTQLHSKVSDTLLSSANALRRDPAASAEFGNFVAARHSTGEDYVLLSDADATANKLPSGTAVLKGAINKDAKTGISQVDPTYIPKGFQSGAGNDPNLLKTYYSLSPKVVDMEKASQSINNERQSLRHDWWTAQGISKPEYDPNTLYAPPINGNKYPFFAYVKQRDGYAMGEGGASVITARSAEELQQKISLLGPEYDAFSKGDIANFKKAQGEYEFNRNFMTNKANTEMARRGILNNITPETRADNLINDLASWHYNQEDQLLRDHIELHNAATFDQLKAMGDRFEQTGTSRFSAITPFMQKSASNPYMDYIRTSIGLSPKDNYPLWSVAQDKLEAFGNTAFNHVRNMFGAVQKGLLPVEEAAKISEKFGLGNPYGDSIEAMSRSYYGGMTNYLPDPNILRKFVSSANTILGSTVINLDTFQQMIHAVTLPIMTALEHSSAAADLKNLTSVTVPGTTQQVPGFMRTLYNGVANYFKDDGTLADLYSKSAGMPRDELRLHRQMIDQLSMPMGKLDASGWTQKIANATATAEKISGAKFTNGFIHFVSSDVGRQLGEASGLAGQDLRDTIATFTNRVLGNVSAGQRAAIFQGPIGQAIGLFQSYQWNLMQQLFRHIGEGDVKALAMGAGMQGSIFGLSSLPGFQALNNLVSQRPNNPSGSDLYSGVENTLGKSAGDYLLYGSLSGLTGVSLYGRGDMNPRRATILPVNPLQFPSVRAGINVYSTLAQLGENLTQKGGNVPASLLFAAEHNGLSRPLTGIIQMMQGYSTAPNGNLVSKVAGLSDLSSIADFSRILGAKPLDEAVRMDAMYRNNAMKVLDTARLNELGTQAKVALRGQGNFDQDTIKGFMSSYVASGGTQDNFNSWFLNQVKGANTAEANKAMNNFHSPRFQTLQTEMGGVPIPDFHNTGGTQGLNVAAGDTSNAPPYVR